MEPTTSSGPALGGEVGEVEILRDVKVEETSGEGTGEEVVGGGERQLVREASVELQDGGEESEAAESRGGEREVVCVGTRRSPVCTRSRTRLLSDTETSQSESELPSGSVLQLERGASREVSEGERGRRVKQEEVEREEGGGEEAVVSRGQKRSPIQTRRRRRCLPSDTETSQSETELPSSSQLARKKTRPHQRRGEEAASAGGRRGRLRKESKERVERGQDEGKQEEDQEDSLPISNRLRSRTRSKGGGGDTSHSESEAPPTTASVQPDEPEVKETDAEAVPPKEVKAPTVRLREWYIKIVGKDLVLLEGKKK